MSGRGGGALLWLCRPTAWCCSQDMILTWKGAMEKGGSGTKSSLQSTLNLVVDIMKLNPALSIMFTYNAVQCKTHRNRNRVHDGSRGFSVDQL